MSITREQYYEGELVSVIIPVYNRANIISRAIRSVLRQSYLPVELLVVDDGSTDGTQDIVEKWSEVDSRVRLIEHRKNRGGSAARNTGIKHARGKYIAFLDSDDEWLRHKLAKQVNFLENVDKHWGGVYCNFKIVSNSLFMKGSEIFRRLSSHSTPASGGRVLLPYLLAGWLPVAAGSTLMVRRQVAKKLRGFDEKFPRHQDWEFLARLLMKWKLGYISEPLVLIYHFSMNKLQSERILKAKQLYLDKFREIISYFEDQGFYIHSQHNLALSKYFYRRGDIVSGTKYLLDSKIIRPVDFSVFLYFVIGMLKQSVLRDI